MTLEEIKKKIAEVIEAEKCGIIRTGDEILKNPEIGYREEKTSALVRNEFDRLGIDYEYPYALTGVKAKLKGRSHRYNICIIGELDALICADSAAHACGHNA